MGKKFRRGPDDELEDLWSAAPIIAETFKPLRDMNDYDGVERFLTRSKAIFEALGAQMTRICGANELSVWTFRVQTVQDRIKGIEICLSTKTTGKFNWKYTLDGMGWIEAVRIGAEQTIGLNTDTGHQDDKGSPN